MAEAAAEHPEQRLSEAARGSRSRSRDLVTRAQHGDQDAFLALYRSTSGRLLAYLRTMVGENDADDIASETWARIVTGLPTFRADRGTFLGWATAIARHRAIDHLRRRNPVTPRPHHLLPDHRAPDDTPGDADELLSTAHALRMISGLPPDQAQAVLLRVVIGLDARTAGHILRKRPGAVRTAAHRGLRTLATRINHPRAEPPSPSSPPTPFVRRGPAGAPVTDARHPGHGAPVRSGDPERTGGI